MVTGSSPWLSGLIPSTQSPDQLATMLTHTTLLLLIEISFTGRRFSLACAASLFCFPLPLARRLRDLTQL